MHISRGLRDYLENYADTGKKIQVKISVSGNSYYNYMCIGIDSRDMISDEKYIISDKKTVSPHNEIKYSLNNSSAEFDIRLNKLPDSIAKLLFAVNIEGEGTMNMISQCSFSICQNNEPLLELELGGNEFRAEKSLVFIELYRKDDKWRFSVIARGFYGGLSELLKLYTNENPTAAPMMPIFINTRISESDKLCLTKGEAFSIYTDEPIIIESGCTADDRKYDLKLLLRYKNGNTVYAGFDGDEASSTPDSAVSCCAENGCIEIKWNSDIASAAIYSCSMNLNEPSIFSGCGAFARIIVKDKAIKLMATDTDADINCNTLCFGELIFGEEENRFDISALEMYGGAYSLNRISYEENRIIMDTGPYIQRKNALTE